MIYPNSTSRNSAYFLEPRSRSRDRAETGWPFQNSGLAGLGSPEAGSPSECSPSEYRVPIRECGASRPEQEIMSVCGGQKFGRNRASKSNSSARSRLGTVMSEAPHIPRGVRPRRVRPRRVRERALRFPACGYHVSLIGNLILLLLILLLNVSVFGHFRFRESKAENRKPRIESVDSSHPFVRHHVAYVSAAPAGNQSGGPGFDEAQPGCHSAERCSAPLARGSP